MARPKRPKDNLVTFPSQAERDARADSEALLDDEFADEVPAPPLVQSDVALTEEQAQILTARADILELAGARYGQARKDADLAYCAVVGAQSGYAEYQKIVLGAQCSEDLLAILSDTVRSPSWGYDPERKVMIVQHTEVTA